MGTRNRRLRGMEHTIKAGHTIKIRKKQWRGREDAIKAREQAMKGRGACN